MADYGNIWLEYRLDTGLVVNAIVWDGAEDYEPPEGLGVVRRGDSGAWAGWTYQGGEFTPPAEELP
jgi:hypothetical protein